MERGRKIKSLYDAMVQDEWDRLLKDPAHKLEYDTSFKFLNKYLPKKGKILDAGGGPGRYTIALAKLGYKVSLLDYSSANVEFAKIEIIKSKLEDNIESVVEGSIVNLKEHKDNEFDAVLCLGGPLSHVSGTKERMKAVSELARVAKKGAPVFISVMGKYGTIMNAPSRFPEEVAIKKHFENFSINGEDDLWKQGNGYSHFFTVDELENIMNDEGLKILEHVGLEGFASPCFNSFNDFVATNKASYKNWMNMHYKLCTEKSVADLSLHFMIIGRK